MGIGLKKIENKILILYKKYKIYHYRQACRNNKISRKKQKFIKNSQPKFKKMNNNIIYNKNLTPQI